MKRGLTVFGFVSIIQTVGSEPGKGFEALFRMAVSKGKE